MIGVDNKRVSACIHCESSILVRLFGFPNGDCCCLQATTKLIQIGSGLRLAIVVAGIGAVGLLIQWRGWFVFLKFQYLNHLDSVIFGGSTSEQVANGV